MRSRYTAHVVGEVDYIMETLHPMQKVQQNRSAVAHWAKHTQWAGLQVIATTAGGPADSQGTVEFKAFYIEKGKRVFHHELSTFTKVGGRWLYHSGVFPKR